MSIVLMFGEEIVGAICAYGAQSEKIVVEKQQFYDELASKWNLRSNAELILE